MLENEQPGHQRRRQRRLKRPARKFLSISPASRTSGWRRLTISSRGGRNRSSWRSSRGWPIGLPRQRILPSKESRTAQIGNPKPQKTGMHTRLSCKIDYLVRSKHRDRSIASEFFTDDKLNSLFSNTRSLSRCELQAAPPTCVGYACRLGMPIERRVRGCLFRFFLRLLGTFASSAVGDRQ